MASMALPPYETSLPKMAIKAFRTVNKSPKPSLHGKTVLVTGSNSGIGLACVKLLPGLDIAHLIMAVRNIAKGEEAAAPIKNACPELKISIWELDMLDYTSITNFAKQCESLPQLDIAILNAGVGSGPSCKIIASTGHEETIQVNYLSTALLAILLLPILSPPNKPHTAEPSRLTIVGSGTSIFSTFANHTATPLLPSFDLPYSGFSAGGERYATSKLLVNMLVHRLSLHVPSSRVIINTVEPGLTSDTNLHRDFSTTGKMIMGVMKKLSARTPEQAANTYLDAIGGHGKESHGGFIMFWEVVGMPPLMYSESGKKCMVRLWEETMEELRFAGVEDVLAGMAEG